MLAYVLARQRHQPPPAWGRALLARVGQALPAFEPRQASDLLSSLAVLGLDPGDAALREVAAGVAARWPECSGKSLSKLLWALGKFGCRPDAAWCAGCLARLERAAGEMDGGALSMAVWGLGKLALLPAGRQLDGLVRLAQERLPGLSSRELQRLVWGLGKLMQQQQAEAAGAGEAGALSPSVWVGLVRAMWVRSRWAGEEEQATLQPTLRWMMYRLRMQQELELQEEQHESEGGAAA